MSSRNRSQPSLASPFVHLSGATAQQDLADAINEPASSSSFPSTHAEQGLEVEDVDRGGARRHVEREDGRHRLRETALACRKFVVLKWALEIISEVSLSALAMVCKYRGRAQKHHLLGHVGGRGCRRRRWCSGLCVLWCCACWVSGATTAEAPWPAGSMQS